MRETFAARIATLFVALLSFCLAGCQPSGPKSLVLGDKYVRQGEYPKALKYLARAALLMPERSEVWNFEGLAYHGMQQPARAMEAYQRALRIDRNFAPAHFNLGVLLLEQDRGADAISELNAYVALQPNDDQGWSRLGDALVRARRMDEADRALSQALKLNNKNADAHNSMGLVHIQRKRPRDAMQSFNSALQYRPGFGAALLNQAVVAQQYFGNNQIALERYRAVLTSKPDSKTAAAVQLAIRQIEESSNPAPPQLAMADLTTNTGISTLLRSNLAMQADRVRTTNNSLPNSAFPSPTVKTNPAPASTMAIKTNAPNISPPSFARNPVTSPPLAIAAPAVAPPEPLSTNPNVNNPAPEPDLQATVEVVKVDKTPELPVARDLDSSANAAATNAMAKTTEEHPLLAPRKKTDEEKRGLLARLKQANPARWFEHEESKSSSMVPIPPRRASIPITQENTDTAPTARLAPPLAPVAPPIFPHYPYRTNSTSVKGNRVQAQRLLEQAGAAYQQRQFVEALSLYRQAANADPNFFDANYNLGIAAFQNKALSLALAADEQAVALKPTSTDARYNFALALREAHYPVDAANELRELLNQSPNEARAHLTLGNLYSQQLDEPALARNHYQHFLDLAPNHIDAGAVRQWLVMHQ